MVIKKCCTDEKHSTKMKLNNTMKSVSVGGRWNFVRVNEIIHRVELSGIIKYKH